MYGQDEDLRWWDATPFVLPKSIANQKSSKTELTELTELTQECSDSDFAEKAN